MPQAKPLSRQAVAADDHKSGRQIRRRHLWAPAKLDARGCPPWRKLLLKCVLATELVHRTGRRPTSLVRTSSTNAFEFASASDERPFALERHVRWPAWLRSCLGQSLVRRERLVTTRVSHGEVSAVRSVSCNVVSKRCHDSLAA